MGLGFGGLLLVCCFDQELDWLWSWVPVGLFGFVVFVGFVLWFIAGGFLLVLAFGVISLVGLLVCWFCLVGGFSVFMWFDCGWFGLRVFVCRLVGGLVCLCCGS